MSLPVLPAELLDNVLQNVAMSDLASAAQTCSTLGPVAQRLLYRHLSVSPCSRNLSIVETLADKAGIARYVRSFRITVDDHIPTSSSFYRLLMKAMSHMTELTSLGLYVNPDATWILQGIDPDIVHSRLERFTCSFAFDSHVSTFLERTPSLLELEVDTLPLPFTSALPSLPPMSIPRLTHFIGSSRLAKIIVPGRPLESVHLHAGNVTEDDITCLAQGTSRVMVIDVTTNALPIPFLNALARHLPHLSCLRVMTTYNFVKAPDIEFCEEIATALGAWSDLTAFEMSGVHWGPCRKGDSNSKAVWLSKPFNASFERDDVEMPIDSDIFMAY